MRFKKTSIIGVIFSLALVLAVTAAFASEPKEPDNTIVFHGQAFNRAGLSQGTLDWLDWYLTLTEEERLAISYVPNELREDRDISTQDAYSSVKPHAFVDLGDKAPGDYGIPLPEKTSEIQSDFPEVAPDDVDLSMLKEQLAKKVAAGEITQALADLELSRTEAMLEQARRGELKLFWYDDGQGNGWIYGAGVFDVSGEQKSIFVDPLQTLQPVYYKDENGKLIPVDPDTVKNGYVLEDGDGVNEYDGNLEDASIIGQRQMELDEYKTLLDQLVKDGKMIRADADTMYASARQLLEQRGEMADLYVCDDGSFVVASWRYPCTRADCVNESSHYHDGVLYAGKAIQDSAVSPEPVPSTAPAQSLTSTAPSTSCGVAGCTETRYHAHNEGRTILLSEPCPVEGCTITGNHIHGDVCYSCNGAGHGGGACDGSCYTYNTSTHHSKSHH